jgi:hypothetical protein
MIKAVCERKPGYVIVELYDTDETGDALLKLPDIKRFYIGIVEKSKFKYTIYTHGFSIKTSEADIEVNSLVFRV